MTQKFKENYETYRSMIVLQIMMMGYGSPSDKNLREKRKEKLHFGDREAIPRMPRTKTNMIHMKTRRPRIHKKLKTCSFFPRWLCNNYHTYYKVYHINKMEAESLSISRAVATQSMYQ